MKSAPTHPLTDANRIATLIGGMLGALLAALLGVARRGAMPALPSVLVRVLHAAAEAEMETQEEVEWVAVPAPWRNGQLLPRYTGAPTAHRLSRAPRPGTLVNGPPAGPLTHNTEPTGIA